MSAQFIQIHPKDSVLAALRNISKGNGVDFKGNSFSAKEYIPAKHEFTFRDLAKGGTPVVADVLDCTKKCRKKGLNLLCTPGNNVESTTGLAGSGRNIICFTTGMGTPTGNPVAPMIKTTLFHENEEYRHGQYEQECKN